MSRVTGGLFLSALLLAFLLGQPHPVVAGRAQGLVEPHPTPPVPAEPAAKANTIVFNDLSDTIILSGVGPSPEPCPSRTPEECSTLIFAPAGATDLTISGGGVIDDPGGITVSDFITVGRGSLETGALVASVSFRSDPAESSIGPCPPTPFTCQLLGTENGQIQTAGTITWLDSTGAPLRTDTIEFASDTTEVPEPASWLLVLTGLPLLGRRRLRRPSGGN
jgi:hypothetical protein